MLSFNGNITLNLWHPQGHNTRWLGPLFLILQPCISSLATPLFVYKYINLMVFIFKAQMNMSFQPLRLLRYGQPNYATTKSWAKLWDTLDICEWIIAEDSFFPKNLWKTLHALWTWESPHKQQARFIYRKNVNLMLAIEYLLCQNIPAWF